jgi:MFS family permease
MLAVADPHLAAAAIIVLLVVSLATVFLLVPPTKARIETESRTASAVLPAGFLRLVFARFLFLLGTFAIGRFLLLLIAERLHIDPAEAAGQTGAILALFAVLTAAAAVPFGALADRVGQLPVMRLGIALAVVGIAAFLPSAGLAGVLVAGIVMSAGTAGFVAANWAATTQLVPEERAGRLMGLANIGTGGAAACAGLLGPLIDSAGFTPAILLAGLAMIVAFVPLTTAAPIAAVEPA